MNDALNDSKHTAMSRAASSHNRIPSYVPKNNQSNSSNNEKDDTNLSLNLSVQEEKRQEAYKMI